MAKFNPLMIRYFGADRNRYHVIQQQGGMFWTGDFDNSGIADFADLGILLNNYNQHAPAAAVPVPEPGTLALATFGLLGALGLLIAARRKRFRIEPPAH